MTTESYITENVVFQTWTLDELIDNQANPTWTLDELTIKESACIQPLPKRFVFSITNFFKHWIYLISLYWNTSN